ncbi:meiotic recombination 11 [Carabus blaptoides fortunei]
MSESMNENNEESDVLNEDWPDEDTLKILVATDIHLGYNEQDPIRGNDSFESFEEILVHAVQNEVDFLLLGGDLFHESKPSPMCYHRCITLLKRYCLGNKPVALEFLSDQSRNFRHLKNAIVNYEDPNLNISIPVFSIHGNHDDPTGAERLSAMDIIADTGLINYFGKWTDLTQVEIYPLLMRKGITKFAIYGLSHIKDERLSRLFTDKKVTMIRPMNSEDWFNILVLHQNRAQNRGTKNYIPETVLPDFLNLVIWGHEHDCLIDPVISVNGPRISQPGSSVATSLAAGEAITKYVGLLRVYKTKHIMNKIQLKTVRPFVFKEITISNPAIAFGTKPTEFARQQIDAVIEGMLEQAKAEKRTGKPKLPLIRLNVNFLNEAMMSNAIRMGQQYVDRVANPTDMLSFKLKRNSATKRGRNVGVDDMEEMEGDQLAERVEELVVKYFDMKHQTLKVLSVKGLSEAVARYIDRNDTDALNDIYNHQYTKTLDKLLEIEDEVDEAKLDELLTQLKKERTDEPDNEINEVRNVLDDETRKARKTSDAVMELSSDEEDAGNSSAFSTWRGGAQTARPARGRGSRGGRRGRARAKAT